MRGSSGSESEFEDIFEVQCVSVQAVSVRDVSVQGLALQDVSVQGVPLSSRETEMLEVRRLLAQMVVRSQPPLQPWDVVIPPPPPSLLEMAEGAGALPESQRISNMVRAGPVAGGPTPTQTLPSFFERNNMERLLQPLAPARRSTNVLPPMARRGAHFMGRGPTKVAKKRGQRASASAAKAGTGPEAPPTFRKVHIVITDTSDSDEEGQAADDEGDTEEEDPWGYFNLDWMTTGYGDSTSDSDSDLDTPRQVTAGTGAGTATTSV